MQPPLTRVAKSALKIVANAAVVLCFLAFCYAGYLKFRSSGQLNWLAYLFVNGMFVCMYVARRDSVSISAAPLAWLLAFAGTVAPVLLRPADPGPLAMTLAGNMLQSLGVVLVAAAMLSLRRSFGIVAAHRGIQTGGMYRLVRHPLYGAELVLQLGFVLGNPSPRNGLLWLLAIVLQTLRARTEERFLRADPEYGAYLARVRSRFVPGVI